MPRYRAVVGDRELGPWQPSRERAWQDAVEAGHASRDPFNARIFAQQVGRVEVAEGDIVMAPLDQAWLDAILLMQSHQDRTMRFIEDRIRTTRDDPRAQASWRVMGREVRTISERERGGRLWLSRNR